MSKAQLDAILQIAAEAPPPANPSPEEMRGWFEAINAQTPLAPNVKIESVSEEPWKGEWHRPPKSDASRLIIYYHGGGVLFGSSRSHRSVTTHLAQLSGMAVLSVDYRLAPEHPAPGAHDDCFAAYRWALAQGFESSGIALAGDSAGGNLALSTALRAREEGLALPGCVVMMSPALDLAGDGESHTTLQNAPLLTKALVDLFNRVYVGEGDLRSQQVTPFYSDMSGLPPTLIHVGSNELLVDDSVTVAQRIEAAGSPVELKVWQDMVHCWQLYGPMLEESMQSIAEIAQFVRAHTA
ncbi:MAG: alpha/beta hydrolase [Candidatus Thiodiazotropha sp.]